MAKRVTRQDRVLQYMHDYGSITTLDAFRDLGITRLSAVIFELKKKGFNIDSSTEFGKNRYGEKTHFSKYFLVKE